MNRIKSIAALVLIATVLSACRTMSPEQAAFQSINATGEFATATLKGWSEYCRQVEGTPKRVDLATHQRVKAVWDKYQQTLLAARQSVRAYKEAYAAWEATGKVNDPPSILSVSVLVNTVYNFAMEFSATVTQAKGGAR